MDISPEKTMRLIITSNPPLTPKSNFFVGALAFFWYFFGTMFMSLALGANERFVKIREFIEDFADKKRAEFLSASSFAKDLAEMRNTIRTLLTDFSNNVLDLFGKKKTPLKLKKLRRNHREVIHNEEMNFSEHTRRKFANTDKNLEEENSFAEKNPVDDDDEEFFDEESSKPTKKSSNKSKKALDLEDMKFIEGFRFGIGLAFLSMALNGFTDDLLFNIPSSMLMWQLGALSASINLMNE